MSANEIRVGLSYPRTETGVWVEVAFASAWTEPLGQDDDEP